MGHSNKNCFTMDEKEEMPLWSPWFCIIARKFLETTWWGTLKKVPKDWTTIHRFDCATHLGGQGRCCFWTILRSRCDLHRSRKLVY